MATQRIALVGLPSVSYAPLLSRICGATMVRRTHSVALRCERPIRDKKTSGLSGARSNAPKMAASHFRSIASGTRQVESITSSDTIYALSSGGAGAAAGVAVIRVSGSRAISSVQKMMSDGVSLPKPRVAGLRRIRQPETLELLDQALVLCFPGPKSFTGEDVVELHLHGSRAVVAGVTAALAATGDTRPAARGEFTRRAFENGRMDLTEVEGLADLIAADTAEQRRQALRQLGGDVRAVFEAWREELKGCLAHAEAVIDFGDDVDDGAFEAVLPRVTALRLEMIRRMDDDRRGEIVRGGVRVAIVGPPNAGKSTLLNILARRPAAIVSPVAGTTRDIVEVTLDMNGIPVIVSDTAGIREHTEDPVEMEGMRRAREAAASADVTVIVQDASAESFRPMDAAAALGAEGSGHGSSMRSGSTLVVANKSDLVTRSDLFATVENEIRHGEGEASVYSTSLKDGVGVDELVDALELSVRARLGDSEEASGELGGDTIGNGVSGSGDVPIITRARHRHHVERAVEAMDVFEKGRTGPIREHFLPMDLATEELRIACRELGAVTGDIHVEEVLDVIFNDFCIGK